MIEFRIYDIDKHNIQKMYKKLTQYTMINAATYEEVDVQFEADAVVNILETKVFKVCLKVNLRTNCSGE